MIKEELDQQDALGTANEPDDYEKTVIEQDIYKVQFYIEQQIINDNKPLEINGKLFDQHTLFPSLETTMPTKQENERHLINEANKQQHIQNKQLFEEPINNYFYQPASLNPHDRDKVWSSYLNTSNLKFSVT